MRAVKRQGLPVWHEELVAVFRSDPGRLVGKMSICVGLIALPMVFVTGRADAFAGPKIRTLQFVTAGVLVGVGVISARGRLLLDRGWRPIDLAAGAVVIGNVVALALSVDPRHSLFGHGLQHQGFLAVVMYVVGFYGGRAFCGDARSLGWILRLIWMVGVAVAAYGVAQRLGLDPIWSERADRRIFASIGQPNALAAYLVSVLVAGFAVVSATHSRPLRWMGVGGLGVVAIALGFTASRAGVLAAAVAVVVYAALSRPGSSFDRRRWFIVGLLVGLIAGAALTVGGLDRRSDHLSLWWVGMAIAVDHPIAGTGQDTYPLVFGDYRDDVLDPATAQRLAAFTPESPHNAYIGTAAGAGFVTLAALLTLVGLGLTVVVREMPRSSDVDRRWQGAAAGIAVGHLITDGFMTPETAGSWVFWVVFGSSAQIALRRSAIRRDESP